MGLEVIRALRIGSKINESTSGSVLFIDANGKLAQDNANLFWDNSNNRLGIGTVNPLSAVHVSAGWVRVDKQYGFHVNFGRSGAFIIQDDDDRIMRSLNFNGGWVDNTPSTFFQLGLGSGFFTSNNGVTLDRFGIVSKGTMITNVGYTAMLAPVGLLDVINNITTKVVTNVRAASGQTADLSCWKNSAGTVIANIDNAGNGQFGSAEAGALILGTGAAGIDYTLTFDGETNDGVITWMEDEDYFKFADDINIDTLTASKLVKTDASKTLVSADPTVAIPVVLTMFDAIPTRASESNWNGGLVKLNDAGALSSGSPLVLNAKGSGKIVFIINAGGDLIGDITATGTSVDRETGTQTASDTSVVTLTGVTTDGSTTDANGNIVHSFTKAYITDKWFTGVVTLTTADTAITDMDVWSVSFEQFNDKSNIVLDTLDANIFTTNVAAEFDAYLYTLEVTGDECNIINQADVHVGGVGGTKAQTAIVNKYFRLRRGNIAKAIDGATDGIFMNVAYVNSPVYVEDVTIKIWATQTTLITP